jgi:hypothetical protein
MLNKKVAKDYLDWSVFRKFLESKVGQPWDEVYHQVCKLADDRTGVGHELRQRIPWEVKLSGVIMRDGLPYTTHSHYGEEFPIDGLYVNPETGILEMGPYRPRRSWRQPHLDELEIDLIRINKDEDYKKIHGGWFHCWTTKSDQGYYRINPITNLRERVEYWVTSSHQRQLSLKEMKEYIFPNLSKGTNSKLYERTKYYLPLPNGNFKWLDKLTKYWK